MHVMKVFSGAKPEFDPILMLQMYSFRMDFPAYAQVILAGFSPANRGIPFWRKIRPAKILGGGRCLKSSQLQCFVDLSQPFRQ